MGGNETRNESWYFSIFGAAVLGQASDESVEVPMGRMKGFIRSQFVHDIGPVEAALEDFLKNPKAGHGGVD